MGMNENVLRCDVSCNEILAQDILPLFDKRMCNGHTFPAFNSRSLFSCDSKGQQTL